MFVGRERELKTLAALYNSGRFQMAVLYGRRRVGKTALLDEFARGKRALYFTAQQKSDALNLRAFSRGVYKLYGLPESTGAFATWEDAFNYLARQERGTDEPLFFVFDEFPYAAQAAPSLPSTLQIAIDHAFKGLNLCLVLCGSNEGFMEGEVLGRKSPLYGRRNAQLHLGPLDFRDAARMVFTDDPIELVNYYAAFGGTPYYLEQIQKGFTFQENLERLFFDISGILYAEPQMLLRQELREPALYSSVLDAVASGATAPKAIAERAGVEQASVGKYLATLSGLGLIERIVPFGERATSRRAMYRIRDPFFAFWYRFVSPNIGAIEVGAGSAVVATLIGGFSTYAGHQFEAVCRQWLEHMNREGRLPFLATEFGAWWGTDPTMREQADIDVAVGNRVEGKVLVGECKWREHVAEAEAIEKLVHRADLLRDYPCKTYALFTKHAVSEGTRVKAGCDDRLMLVSAEDLYR